MYSDKFYPLDQLVEKIQEEKKRHKTIALANGGFDLIHIGHVRYLREAAKVADILVLALNSDASLKKLKGDHRAILDQHNRITILSSFSFIDYITVFDELTVDNVLLTLTPNFHCKGSDYTPETVPERHTVRSYGGQIAIVGGAKVRSTSEIITHIRSLYL